MDRIYKSKNFFVRNTPIILAFLVPVVVLSIMFAFREIFPFGDQMYLRSDMYHQYATFLKEFQSILKNGDSLLYTWNIGLGSDLPGTYAYYLASPVYWLMGLLPSQYVPECMAVFIILKAGLMSATFAYYVQSHYGKRSFLSGAFGIFYAMSSYMAAYSWNVMWLDCLVLLPLITLGLERLVKEKKVILYTVTLGLSVLSNYYISIMISIFLVLYFLYLIICESGFSKAGDKNRFLIWLKKAAGALGRFAAFSAIAGLMAAATVIPALINLSSTASGNFSFPSKLRIYFNFLEMISHGIMNVEPTVLSGYIPNIYCTVSMFILVPLFLILKKTDVKVKLGKVVLMAIFLVSFALNIPTYIWHGFHFPNSLSSRQSFIYIFLILAIGYEVVINIRSFKYREIAGCFVAAECAIFALQVLFDSEKFTLLLVAVSALFLALYCIWMLLAKSGKVLELILIIMMFAIAISEAAINTDATGYSTTSRVNYMKDNEAILTLLDGIEDDSFYRVEKVKRRTKNDGAWLNYRSASEFSSTTLKGISDLYDDFGMQSSTNSFSYYGHTPLVTAILDVKYELSAEPLDDQLMTLVGEAKDMYLYENKYVLPLGFMVKDNIRTDVTMEGSNPFNTQNSFLVNACGVSNLFENNSSVSGTTVTVPVRSDGRGFIYISEKLDEAQVTIMRGNSILKDNAVTGLENQQIIDIGDVKKGDSITVKSNDEDVTDIRVFSSVMSYEKLEAAYNALSANVWEISSFSDTEVKGTVNADESGMLFTSIPYYRGWDVYVDGVRSEYTSFENAFILLPLSKGEHSVEFRYHSPGFGAALLITFFSILLFVFICLLRRGNRGRNLPVKAGFEDREGIEVSDTVGGDPAVNIVEAAAEAEKEIPYVNEASEEIG